jgi:hypothetical protein
LNLLDLFFKDLITKLLKEKRDITAWFPHFWRVFIY